VSKQKDLGQFWTPDWVAKAMVAFGLNLHSGVMLDPSVGLGVFPRWANALGLGLEFAGVEKDRELLSHIPDPSIRSRILVGDFLTAKISRAADFVVANPPYIRHHRLHAEYKRVVHTQTRNILGFELDRRAGIHIHFLVKSLHLLKPGGRLAFIVPADVFEGVFSQPLWSWISRNYRIDAVTTFAPEASPFPSLDINPVVIFLQNAAPAPNFRWARILRPETDDFFRYVTSGFTDIGKSMESNLRTTDEAIATGLSRPPRPNKAQFVLKDFAYVRRGIATGANSFFLLTREMVDNLQLDKSLIRKVIPKTRYLKTLFFTEEDFGLLAEQGHPVYLFAPDGRPLDQFSETVRSYLKLGEELGLPQKALIGQRNPWYKMETRVPPDYLFAYLGRRNIRFVRNLAGVSPLTTLLAVYARNNDEKYIRELHTVLNHPDVLSGLVYVAKSYGNGALKAEPRQLELLPIPDHLAERLLMQPALFK